MTLKDKFKKELESGKSPIQIQFENGLQNDQTKEYAKKKLKECYEGIIHVLKTFVDLKEEYYPLVAIWIIGTYFHKKFNSYPYLFFNAMKGSGKTRTLKIIEALCWNGKITNSLTESVLFRTAETSSILIDEFEGVGGRDKATMRELLNSAYKKGTIVERMRKKTSKEGEELVVESFNLYCPVVMANIWGMNEVLESRCISLLLEKSKLHRITTLIEDFKNDPFIVDIKNILEKIQCYKCSLCISWGSLQEWNKFINDVYRYTYTTLTTYSTPEKTIELFNFIYKTNIRGRDLELFFPIFLISWCIDSVVFRDILAISKQYCHERKEEEYIQSRDIALLDFVSKKTSTFDFVQVNELTREFKMFFEGDDENQYINSRWVGRALKRLNVIRDKRRISRGVEVNLDSQRAKDKLKEFKNEVEPKSNS